MTAFEEVVVLVFILFYFIDYVVRAGICSGCLQHFLHNFYLSINVRFRRLHGLL